MNFYEKALFVKPTSGGLRVLRTSGVGLLIFREFFFPDVE
jgi:hypothetical protein